MKSRNQIAPIATLCLGALAGLGCAATAYAGSQGHEETVVRYTEIAGEMEFSGMMIARPKSVEALRQQGLSRAAAEGAHESAADYLLQHFNVRRHVHQTDQYVFDVPNGETESDVANRLMATGQYKFVQPNWVVYPVDCPDDSQFGSQWYHDANHFESCDGWNVNTGSPSVSVGVCDTGVRVTHEDLLLNRLEGYNAVDRIWESNGGQISDIYGHGTDATGCVTANGDNGVGVAGVGWNLSHRMLRVTNSTGGGSTIEILNHAAMTAVESGDRVASLSYSGVENQATLDTATYIKSIGGLMIWAAGNSSQNMTMNDRDADDVIVVGAVDRNEDLAWFSNYGRFVDFVSYGVDVWNISHESDSAYANFGGTSAACPLVSGLAGLIWSQDPSLTPDEVEQIIKDTCVDLGSGGIDNTFGYGRIHVGDAMNSLPDDRMRLDIGSLVAGQMNTFAASNCTPNKTVFFGYSTKGLGNTYISQLDVTLDLQNPKRGPTASANNSGEASVNAFVPGGAAGLQLWIQAAQVQRISDVWEGVVQ